MRQDQIRNGIIEFDGIPGRLSKNNIIKWLMGKYALIVAQGKMAFKWVIYKVCDWPECTSKPPCNTMRSNLHLAV